MKKGAGESAALSFVAASLLILFVLGSALVAGAVTTSTTSTATSASAASTSAANPTSLVLSVLPPKLPADGGTYPAIVISLQSTGGKASLALNDTTVFLTSSQAGVGSVADRVTIVKGTGFAVANFTSSTTPGTTSISASSVGLNAVSAQVTTVNPSGLATRLKVIPVPGTQLVNPTATGMVLVETLDSAGLPAAASSDVFVSLSSSNTNVVSLPSNSLTVSSGSVLSSATYNVGFTAGSAVITASASGFNSGSGTVAVQGPSPLELRIFAEPNPMPTSSAGRLIVTLTDSQGNPARAPAAVPVSISSSNTTVIASDQAAIIPVGQTFVVAGFSSGTSLGSANITASSPALKSDFQVVTVAKPGPPVKLKLIISPNPVLADKGSYNSVVVALTDASGNPAVAASDVAVTLTSSSADAGNIAPSVRIASGSSYAIATFTSTFFVGSTTITALAQNFQSATAMVNTFGPIPSKILVQAVPPNLPADGRDYPALEVILVDPSGSPAIAPVGIPVQLASSRTDIATVNSTVVIAPGQSYVLTDVVTAISPGIANITATSSGFVSSSTGFTTSSPAPSQLGVFIAPASGIQSLGARGDAILAVQLQDSTSSPARARQDTQIVVTGSNSSVIAKPIQMQILAGGDYAWAYVKTSAPGTSILTASTSGLTSASASLTELSLPVSVTFTGSAPVISMGTTASLQVMVQVMGAPLKGAKVAFTTTSGIVNPAQSVTDSSGVATAVFIPQANGVATITAVVSHPAVGNQTAGTNILVTLPGGANAGGATGPTGGGLGLIGTVLPILVVIIVIVIIVVGVRRIARSRRSIDELEEEAPEKEVE